MTGETIGPGSRGARVFVSHSRADRERMERLLLHVSPVAEQELGVSFWTGNSIALDTVWADEIANAIGRANIFILCMTADYLASKYLYYHEYPAIKQRHDASNALILPVILSPCPWWGFVGDFQVAPARNGRVKPISEWRPQETGYHAAADQIIAAIRKHLGLAGTEIEAPLGRGPSKMRRLGPVTLPGPHKVPPDEIDRAVEALIARRAAEK